MFRILKLLTIPLNSELSTTVCATLSSLLQELKFTPVPDSLKTFEEMAKKLQSSCDLFIWNAADMPETIPQGIDFFFIPDLNAAIIFKTGDSLLQTIRSYYCPPVAFIGGGPGNHEWLTIEAKNLLERCDIVFYDALVNPLIVASLPEDVERFYVGKRGDSKSFNQEELNSLIANHAKRGYKVGRLKGGDPGILGRITEEIDTLLKDRLSFTITPGISAMQAISSAAGIHLTQRGVCDRVTITTARSAGGEINNLLPFKDASLIVYMGILTAEKIQEQLKGAGYQGNMPTAILVNLTRSGQKVFHTTLDELATTVNTHKIRPPGLLVFGETARKDLQRLPAPSPLAGRRVLLTGTDNSAIKASMHLRRWGATPIFLCSSLLTIDDQTITPEYDDIIFFSAKEVSDFYETLGGPKINAECNIISIGKEIDATFSCLFRKDTLIADNHRHAIDLLRKALLYRLLE